MYNDARRRRRVRELELALKNGFSSMVGCLGLLSMMEISKCHLKVTNNARLATGPTRRDENHINHTKQFYTKNMSIWNIIYDISQSQSLHAMRKWSEHFYSSNKRLRHIEIDPSEQFTRTAKTNMWRCFNGLNNRYAASRKCRLPNEMNEWMLNGLKLDLIYLLWLK